MKIDKEAALRQNINKTLIYSLLQTRLKNCLFTVKGPICFKRIDSQQGLQKKYLDVFGVTVLRKDLLRHPQSHKQNVNLLTVWLFGSLTGINVENGKDNDFDIPQSSSVLSAKTVGILVH